MSGSHTMFHAIRNHARRLDENEHDYDELLELAEHRDFVLLGESTHGTSEFYRMRADITRRLIEEKGFDAIAVEADWPDALRINRFVGGAGDTNVMTAFEDFLRFPQWMWRNREVADFITWLADYNASRGRNEQIGFYGLDLYSLYRSADAVVSYLESVDPEQAEIARHSYECLDHVRDPQHYGYEAAFGIRPQCRESVLKLMADLSRKAADYLSRNGLMAANEQFYAEQNAHVVVNAEHYYRAMFGSRINTWNLRDEHMTGTLFALQQHLRKQQRAGKIVVWAHNSHIGDARATEMGWSNEYNIGQLVRTRAGDKKTLLVGFTTYTGHVAAARRWDGPVEHRWVRPALAGSYEQLFYSTRMDRFFLPLDNTTVAALREIMLERAIGVIYLPESERSSHYFRASLLHQFDAVFHLDETSAVDPLDITVHWEQQELPETYPFGV